MDKLRGYAGNILKVNLTSRSISRIPLTPELATEFIGGAGINARLAYDYIDPNITPFSPENAVVLGVGPLVGTLAPGAGKSNVTSKSPISHFISTSGTGHMGILKFTGYDNLIVTGKSDSPVYLEIGDKVRIREAGHIWGKDTWKATDAIWRELGRQYAVAAIGPAGENLVKDACVIVNKYSAYARTGIGAVMGSKNLKAIAAYGSKGISIADPKRFMKLVNGLCQEITSLPYVANFRTRGTLINLDGMIKLKYGSIPYKNCQGVADEQLMKSFDLKRLDQLMEKHGNISCLACPLGCKHFMRLKGGVDAGLAMAISCAAVPVVCFGGNCAVEGWFETLKCAELCNQLGMDYASASSLIAMAIELYQRGIIDEKDTGGLELNWQASVVQDLLQRIAYRKGFGNILADGLMEAPRHIGRGSDHYAIQYKGIGNTIGDPRPLFTSLLSSMLTNVIGHTYYIKSLYGESQDRLRHTLKRMGMSEGDLECAIRDSGECNFTRVTKWTEDYSFALECLGVCVFDLYQRFNIDLWAQVYEATTGIPMDGAGLLQAAARGIDMRRAFNIREGASRKDDSMPKRFQTEPIKVGDKVRPPFDSEHLDRLITAYYKERGWDPQEGTLTPLRLAELTQYR